MRSCKSVVALVIFVACGGSSPNPNPTPPPSNAASPLAAEATRGLSNPDVASLFADHWDGEMKRSPLYATTRGDHRFDTLLADNSHAGVLAERAEDKALLARAKAIDPAGLTELEATSLALLVGNLERNIAVGVCDSHLWELSAFGNLVSRTSNIPELHKIKSQEDAFNLLARYEKVATFGDNAIANLKLGAEKGLFANAESVRRALAQIDKVLETPVAEWALMAPAKDPAALAAFSDEKAKAEWLEKLYSVTNGAIKTSFESYRAFLASEILPKARGVDSVGVGALPNGAACYKARVARYLGIEKTADELHELGLAEIKRINDEMIVLGKKLFDTDDLGAITTRLRTDPKLYFNNANEIMNAAREVLDAANKKAPEYFGIMPQAPCIVTPIPDHEAPFSTVAYYRQPQADGTPGKYFINTYKPEVRPRFEMAVLSIHEAVPGHHLQIAIAQEREELPLFRREYGSTAFVEGWALYTERLAGEMGLYESDLDRMGMLSYDAWRASRLVVDTGIHAKGWTRERAEEFMREHTALAGANIVNEVDRYINWPGQALAYKVGQLEILRLRENARSALGERFDIKAFHDVVLSRGAVSLPVLAGNVARWVESL